MFPALFTTLLITIFCSFSVADQKTDTERNALIIQADFAGLVMTGVAYTVSKELDIFNVRPLINLYDIAEASASLEYNAQTWPAG